MKHLLFVFCLSASITGISQDLGQWPQDSLNLANTASSAPYLSLEEKKAIQLINLARLDGRAFSKRIARPYFEQNQIPTDEYVETLFEDLARIKGLSLVQPLQKLHESAAHHAHDMGHKGLFGHESSDGTGHLARMHRYHKGAKMAESLCYGYSSALDIVMQLLYDEGIELKTNRHQILSPEFHHLGISIKAHKVYEFNCVIDFSSL